MTRDCPVCERFREERAEMLRTSRRGLGDLLVRVALHEGVALTSRLRRLLDEPTLDLSLPLPP